MLEPHESDLCRLVAATPDTTLAELQAVLQRRFGIGAGLSTIHNALHRLGLRQKKTLRAAERDAELCVTLIASEPETGRPLS